MVINKLTIGAKRDNPAKRQMMNINQVAQSETLSSSEINAIVSTTNELVEHVNNFNAIDAFNFKGNVTTYANLPTTGLIKDDAYGVIADGLVYIYNGTAFPTSGNGLNLGLKPVGKVEQGDALAVSGGEVYKNTAVPKDLGLRKFFTNDSVFKFSDFTNTVEFVPNTYVGANGVVGTLAGYSTTRQPIKQGTHKMNLYLTAVTCLVTLNEIGEVVNVYNNHANYDEWTFTTNKNEVEILTTIRNTQLPNGGAPLVYITAGSDYNITTSDVFLKKELYTNLGIIGVRQFQIDDNILKYSNKRNIVEFIPNSFVDNTGLVGFQKGYYTTKQKVVSGRYVTNLYLTAVVTMVTLNDMGEIVNIYTNKGNYLGNSEWSFTIGENEEYIVATIVGILDVLYIKTKQPYNLKTNDVFKNNNQPIENDIFGVCLGDSVTMGGNYPWHLSKNIGVNFENFGIGGTTLSYSNGSGILNPLNICNWIDAISSNDFTYIKSQLDNFISNTTSNKSRAEILRAKLDVLDFSKLKYITIFAGTNDWSTGRQIGSDNLSNLDKTTLFGAVNYCIEKICRARPDVKIFFITPTHRFINPDLTEENDSDNMLNPIGNKLIEYVDAIDKSSKLNHVPCKNMYNEGFFNKFNHSYYFVDGVHPNNNGYEFIGEQIACFVKSKITI